MRLRLAGSRSRFVKAMYIRNFLFGGEDSLVSTVGLLSGLAAAGSERPAIVLTGIVLIFVEALSMAVGSFLSENSAEEYLARSAVSARDAIRAGLIMFFSYSILGMIPLVPYLLLDVQTAFPASIAFSIGALFLLGMTGGTGFRVHPVRNALRMSLLGGLAIIVGITVGHLVT